MILNWRVYSQIERNTQIHTRLGVTLNWVFLLVSEFTPNWEWILRVTLSVTWVLFECYFDGVFGVFLGVFSVRASSQLILVAANIECTWARSAPASCDFAIAGWRRVVRARGSLNIVSPFALKILFHYYMYVKCVLLFVVIEKIENAHAGKPRTDFYNIIMSDCLYKFYRFLLSIMGFLSIKYIIVTNC